MIGVLALQGDFQRHLERLQELGAKATLVNKVEQLSGIRGLIIPGGESSVILRLSTPTFREALSAKVLNGIPVLATCAGLIFIADQVENPRQESLKLLDVDVVRNAYGRQLQSFIAPSLEWTACGKELLEEIKLSRSPVPNPEGVFIRAPKIKRIGRSVDVLIEHENEPVLVRQQNILAATFHPELSRKADVVHEVFLSLPSA